MRLHIAVTGLNATDDPSPGLNVIRSLREWDDGRGQVKIIGLAYDALDTGIHAPGLIDEVYLLPYASEGLGNLIHRIREIRQRTRIDVIIPTLDGEILNFCQAAPILRPLGIRMLLPGEAQIRLHFKHALPQFCLEHGLPTPRIMLIYEAKQLWEAFGTLGMPLVLKGILHEAHVAHTLTQAQVYFDLIRSRWGIPLVAQEYIRGEGAGVVALCDRKSQVVGMVAMRKLAVTEKGKAWSGVTVKDEEMLGIAVRVLEALEWVGPVELEFMRQAETGKLSLLEVNPRFPTWVYLAAMAGQNLPAAAVQLALRKTVEPFNGYKEGIIYVRHAQDIICSMEQLAQVASRGELVLTKPRKVSANGKGTQADSERAEAESVL